MEIAIFLLIAIFIILEIFWFIQLLDLMARHDNIFPGRYDKLIWAAVLLISNVIGAFAYFITKSHKNQPQLVNIKEPPKESPEPCLQCGKTIPADAKKCPFCGWSYDEDR
jgi:hypothetical protein